MGYEHIRHGGNALRHILGVFLLAWRHVVRTAGIAMIAGIAITEIVGALATRHFPPYLLTHVVALAVGIAVAYCVGLTVLVDELIKGTLALVRMALGEVEAGARAAAIIAEREAGDVWGWARRLIVGRDAVPSAQLRPRLAPPNMAPVGDRATSAASAGSLRPTARTLGEFATGDRGSAGPAGSLASRQALAPPESGDPARLRVPPRLGATPASAAQRDETEEDVAATEVFRRTAPPAPANAHPVPADRLPRIEWAAEGLAAGAALLQSALAARARHAQLSHAADAESEAGDVPAPAATPLEAMPPLPPRVPDAAVAPPSPADAPVPAVASQPAAAHSAPPTVPLAPTPVVAAATAATGAPTTIPLDLAVSTPTPPPPQPRSSVRTVPVITDDTSPAALEAAEAAMPPTAPPNVRSNDAAEESVSLSPSPHPSADAEPTDWGAEARAEVLESEPDPGSDAPWEPPSRTIVLPAAASDAAAQGTGAGTGVLPSDDDEPAGAEARGLWLRIGQALARSTTRPLREQGGDGDSDGTDQLAP